MGNGPFPVAARSQDGPWLSVSDLMSGLMLVFLCIAVLYLRNQAEVAKQYQQVQDELAEAMRTELSEEELNRWGAELDQTGLVVRFVRNDNQFNPGKAEVLPEFRESLREFFPQLVRVLATPGLTEHVVEVRIEGHTSSDYEQLPALQAYLANMELSQQRAVSVLRFVVSLDEVEEAWGDWLAPVLRANGLSSSQRIMDGDQEDLNRSRRVEFRIVTDAEDRMRAIVKAVGGGTQ